MPITIKILLITTVLAAGIYDLRFRRIPNWLNVSGVIAGLLMNAALFSGHGLAQAGLGIACALLIYVPLYLVRGMGAGDVKLMAAVGAIAGPWNWLGIFVLTALLGGLASVILIGLRRRVLETSVNVATIVTELCHLRPPSRSNPSLDIRDPNALRLPHGTVIALGSMAFLLLSKSF